MADHRTTVGQSFLEATWDVTCMDCDFKVADLSSSEAAIQTAHKHASGEW